MFWTNKIFYSILSLFKASGTNLSRIKKPKKLDRILGNRHIYYTILAKARVYLSVSLNFVSILDVFRFFDVALVI
jgi:hypothetical protein